MPDTTHIQEQVKEDVTPPKPHRRPFSGYSFFVASMKFLLPVAAVALIALVAAWPQLSGRDTGFRIGFAGLDPKDAASLNMQNARYVGLDRNQRPFTVTADMVSQESAKSNTVGLDRPKADMHLRSGAWVMASAETGIYHTGEQTLDLAGSVTLIHDAGYQLETASAHVDLSKGTASGGAQVTGHGPAGQIVSEGFELSGQGERILFTGRSRLILNPAGAGGSANAGRTEGVQ